MLLSPASQLPRFGSHYRVRVRTLSLPATARRLWAKPIRPATLSSAAGVIWASCLCLVLFFLGNPRAYGQPAIFWQHWAAVLGVVAFLLTVHTLRPPTIPWSALAFVGFGALTAFWSPDPHVTLVFAARLIALTLFAAYVASALDFRAQLAAVGGSGVIVAVTSAIEYARGNPDVIATYPWRGMLLEGIHGNRNIMAFTLVLALWALVARVPDRWPGRTVWIVALITVIGGIYTSGSTTGLVSVVALVGAAIVLGLVTSPGLAGRLGRRVGLVATGAVGVVTAGGVAVYVSQERSLANDLALSGRLDLWKQILNVTHGRDLWFGHGWGSVWPYNWLNLPDRADLYERIVGPLGVRYVHGHNSLMDPLPEIGVVGVGLLLGGFLWVAVKAIRLLGKAKTPGHRLVGRAGLLGLIALAITGVTEPMSVILVGAFMFALIAANVVAASSESRRQASEGAESMDKESTSSGEIGGT